MQHGHQNFSGINAKYPVAFIIIAGLFFGAGEFILRGTNQYLKIGLDDWVETTCYRGYEEFGGGCKLEYNKKRVKSFGRVTYCNDTIVRLLRPRDPCVNPTKYEIQIWNSTIPQQCWARPDCIYWLDTPKSDFTKNALIHVLTGYGIFMAMCLLIVGIYYYKYRDIFMPVLVCVMSIIWLMLANCAFYPSGDCPVTIASFQFSFWVQLVLGLCIPICWIKFEYLFIGKIISIIFTLVIIFLLLFSVAKELSNSGSCFQVPICHIVAWIHTSIYWMIVPCVFMYVRYKTWRMKVREEKINREKTMILTSLCDLWEEKKALIFPEIKSQNDIWNEIWSFYWEMEKDFMNASEDDAVLEHCDVKKIFSKHRQDKSLRLLSEPDTRVEVMEWQCRVGEPPYEIWTIESIAKSIGEIDWKDGEEEWRTEQENYRPLNIDSNSEKPV